mmetsp:Transcript_3707/g.8896  ORF Transcript_3707/g.8896 Transcript_3707/m.8896 type:complete len:209 (-) Transcript_3707:2234-2860(-)
MKRRLRRDCLLLLLPDVQVVGGEVGRVGYSALLLAVPDGAQAALRLEPVHVLAVEVHAVHGEPPLVQALVPAVLHAVAGDEVNERQVPAGRHEVQHGLQRLLPRRDHGQAVAARHQVRVLRQLLAHLGRVDVALHQHHLAGQAKLDHAGAGHVQQGVAEVHQVHLGARRLAVAGDELNVARGAAPDADPRLGLAHPRHGVLHQQVAVG